MIKKFDVFIIFHRNSTALLHVESANKKCIFIYLPILGHRPHFGSLIFCSKGLSIFYCRHCMIKNFDVYIIFHRNSTALLHVESANKKCIFL